MLKYETACLKIVTVYTVGCMHGVCSVVETLCSQTIVIT